MRHGFTLIEMMVAIGVMVILITSMLAYSSASKQEIGLQLEKAKIAQVILKAKELAVGTFYEGSNPPCAYGVHFNYAAQTYTLHSYDVTTGGGCGVAFRGGPTAFDAELAVRGTESSYSLEKGLVKIASGMNPIEYVLFEPPSPRIYIWLQGDTVNPSTEETNNVNLSTADGSSGGVVSVNLAGQVTF